MELHGAWTLGIWSFHGASLTAFPPAARFASFISEYFREKRIPPAPAFNPAVVAAMAKVTKAEDDSGTSLLMERQTMGDQWQEAHGERLPHPGRRARPPIGVAQ